MDLHTQLRPFQEQALAALADPGHVLCVAPTGSGKSLIYERFLLETGCRGLIISPLVALARQQSKRLAAVGLPVAESLGGSPTPEARVRIASPEALTLSPRTVARLKGRIDLVVVDECHCVWEWGPSFRPAFLRLAEVVRELEAPRSLWLTATLPPAARDTIVSRLAPPVREVGGFEVPRGIRLSLERLPWSERPLSLASLLERERGPGLVYVATRALAERISLLLRSFGRRAHSFHAGMSREERVCVESSFRDGRLDVLAATTAFGLGMDVGGLEWVTLWQPPRTLLALAQLVGRVGRSGRAGRAAVYWDDSDFLRPDVPVGELAREWIAVRDFLRSTDCRRRRLEGYFLGQVAPAGQTGCGECDTCLATTAVWRRDSAGS